MNSKRSIHRNTKKNGKGNSRKNAARYPSQREDMVEKCTKYMRFFYWSFMVVQLLTGSTNNPTGIGSLVLFLKEVLNETFLK